MSSWFEDLLQTHAPMFSRDPPWDTGILRIHLPEQVKEGIISTHRAWSAMSPADRDPRLTALIRHARVATARDLVRLCEAYTRYCIVMLCAGNGVAPFAFGLNYAVSTDRLYAASVLGIAKACLPWVRHTLESRNRVYPFRSKAFGRAKDGVHADYWQATLKACARTSPGSDATPGSVSLEFAANDARSFPSSSAAGDSGDDDDENVQEARLRLRDFESTYLKFAEKVQRLQRPSTGTSDGSNHTKGAGEDGEDDDTAEADDGAEPRPAPPRPPTSARAVANRQALEVYARRTLTALETAAAAVEKAANTDRLIPRDPAAGSNPSLQAMLFNALFADPARPAIHLSRIRLAAGSTRQCVMTGQQISPGTMCYLVTIVAHGSKTPQFFFIADAWPTPDNPAESTEAVLRSRCRASPFLVQVAHYVCAFHEIQAAHRQPELDEFVKANRAAARSEKAEALDAKQAKRDLKNKKAPTANVKQQSSRSKYFIPDDEAEEDEEDEEGGDGADDIVSINSDDDAPAAASLQRLKKRKGPASAGDSTAKRRKSAEEDGADTNNAEDEEEEEDDDFIVPDGTEDEERIIVSDAENSGGDDDDAMPLSFDAFGPDAIVIADSADARGLLPVNTTIIVGSDAANAIGTALRTATSAPQIQDRDRLSPTTYEAAIARVVTRLHATSRSLTAMRDLLYQLYCPVEALSPATQPEIASRMSESTREFYATKRRHFEVAHELVGFVPRQVSSVMQASKIAPCDIIQAYIRAINRALGDDADYDPLYGAQEDWCAAGYHTFAQSIQDDGLLAGLQWLYEPVYSVTPCFPLAGLHKYSESGLDVHAKVSADADAVATSDDA